MRILIGALCVVVAAETVCLILQAHTWISKPRPPTPNLKHLHPTTSSEIHGLEKRISQQPDDARAWSNLALAYTVFGFYPEAEWCSRRAVEIAPLSFEAAWWWGIALHQLGQPGQAIDRFHQALLLADGDRAAGVEAKPRCWYGIGRNYLRQEDLAAAETAFRRAGPFLPAKHQLSRILIRFGRADEAIDLLDQLIPDYPNRTLYQLRAQARSIMGDSQGAFDDRNSMERAPHQLPSDLIVYLLQLELERFGLKRRIEECRQLARSGRAGSAVHQLRGLLAVRWRSSIADELWKAELQCGQASEAAETLKQLNTRLGLVPSRLSALGDAHRSVGEVEQAVRLWDRAARLGSVPEPHAQLTKYFSNVGDKAKSRQHLGRQKQLLGIASWRLNDLKSADRELEDAVELDSQLRHAWFYLGETRRLRGQTSAAELAYRRCLEIRVGHGRALAGLKRIGTSL